jgi:hypothetical protein
MHLLLCFGIDDSPQISKPNRRQQMHIKTVLNKCHKFKSFVYGQVKFVGSGEEVKSIEVDIAARKNGKAVCSGCDQIAPLYDRLGARRFEFIPLWGCRVFFVYIMRRVSCPSCGVTVERVPWGSGKRELTSAYMQFLAHWAVVMAGSGGDLSRVMSQGVLCDRIYC